MTSGPLQALSNAAGGGNGVFIYGTGGGFPSNSGNGSNYWVDVTFSSTPPVVANTTPTPGATGVSATAPNITATFNEAVQSSPLSFGAHGSPWQHGLRIGRLQLVHEHGLLVAVGPAGLRDHLHGDD